jgi:hypothetical protein
VVVLEAMAGANSAWFGGLSCQRFPGFDAEPLRSFGQSKFDEFVLVSK